MSPTKLLFFGTPDLSVPFLEALVNEPDFEVTAVVTQPDRPIGRKQVLASSPVKKLALNKGILVLQPESLKNDSLTPLLPHPLTPFDIFVVVAYGLLIPQKILKMPRLGCVNVHPSLLPKYRGPSPIQSAIVAGDAETGISIMLLDQGMDTGPILAQEKIALASNETQISLIEKIKKIGPKFLIQTLRDYAADKIQPQPQDNSQATVCKLLDRESGKINWSRPAAEIDRLVRAYQPWPGTWAEFDHKGKKLRVKILQTKINNGRLEILQVQPEGGGVMDYQSFVRGYGEIN